MAAVLTGGSDGASGRGAVWAAGEVPHPTESVATAASHLNDMSHAPFVQPGHRTTCKDAGARPPPSLVSTKVVSSRKATPSPCTSSPATLQTGRALGARRPP